MYVIWGLFWLYALRFWEGSPWLFKICYIITSIATVYLACKTIFDVHKNQQLLSLIVPELEAGDLFPSDVDYFDEVLQMFVYDHYLIGCGQADCVDLYDIKVVKLPHPKRFKRRPDFWGLLQSGGNFSIKVAPLNGVSSRTRLHKLANYLQNNFEVPIDIYY